MNDGVRCRHQLTDDGKILNAAPHEPKSRAPLCWLEILQPARGQIVQHQHIMTITKQPLDEVRSDKSGSARDQVG
jgi:hypothetical protein